MTMPISLCHLTSRQSRQQGVNGIVSGYPGVQLQFQVQTHIGLGHFQRRAQNIVCWHLLYIFILMQVNINILSPAISSLCRNKFLAIYVLLEGACLSQISPIFCIFFAKSATQKRAKWSKPKPKLFNLFISSILTIYAQK